jgi:hypothetical protein
MFVQLLAEIVPSLIKGRPNNNDNNNNKAKCIPGSTLRVLAGNKNHVFVKLVEQAPATYLKFDVF